uniref:Fanconi anemia core complex-associated protein 20 n=1 Tax=Scatophagus argus TaxID=75038 RepID=UPI001ED7EBBB|nr:Fanconi anemia core complex-associated protein 20 [Scatophagus argus]
MFENHSKSKLKRKKSSVEVRQPEISFTVTLNRSRTSMFGSDLPAEPGRSAAVWWNREQLPAVESLWALTLKSAVPYLEDQRCHLVPDLPPPSTVRPTALKLGEQWRCDLSEEVAPLPELPPASQRTSSRVAPVSLGSSQQDLSAMSQPVPDPPDRHLSSSSGQNHDDKTTSFRVKSPQLSLHSWEGTVSDMQVSLQKHGENKEEVVGDEEEVQRRVRGDGEAAGEGMLQSCPMCLLVFPAGFTQMDCDGHLAQCLSEVNVDMTW